MYLHELSLIINKYEGTTKIELDFEPLNHHGNSKRFQNQFIAHVSQLKTLVLTNQFNLNKLTLLNNEKTTFNDIVYNHISKMLKLEEEQFKAFWMDRLVTYKIPVSNPISLNLLNLPGKPNKATEKDPVLTAGMMKKRKKTSEAQRKLVENSLPTEIFEIYQSLSANQYSLYHSTRLHVTSQFHATSKPSFHVKKKKSVLGKIF